MTTTEDGNGRIRSMSKAAVYHLEVTEALGGVALDEAEKVWAAKVVRESGGA